MSFMYQKCPICNKKKVWSTHVNRCKSKQIRQLKAKLEKAMTALRKIQELNYSFGAHTPEAYEIASEVLGEFDQKKKEN